MDLRPEGADFKPEWVDFKPERADLRPEKAWGDKRINEQFNKGMNQQINKNPPMIYRTSSSLGPLPKKKCAKAKGNHEKTRQLSGYVINLVN